MSEEEINQIAENLQPITFCQVPASTAAQTSTLAFSEGLISFNNLPPEVWSICRAIARDSTGVLVSFFFWKGRRRRKKNRRWEALRIYQTMIVFHLQKDISEPSQKAITNIEYST
jgi:hypothetical protein